MFFVQIVCLLQLETTRTMLEVDVANTSNIESDTDQLVDLAFGEEVKTNQHETTCMGRIGSFWIEWEGNGETCLGKSGKE